MILIPAPERKILRRMNYISDQRGILRRYRRERSGWKSHLEQAGNFITDVLREGEFRHIVVLGSGWLLDFPIENIQDKVERITLVDVHFPGQVLRSVRKYNHTECIAADITGGFIQAVYQQARNARQEFYVPPEIHAPAILPEKGMLILSLNVLNQLDILLVDYIRDHMRCSEFEILNLRRIIQESHIRMLRDHPFVLISDYREILMNSQGKIMEEKELIFTSFPQGDRSSEWEWLFDSHQLYNSNANTRMKVKAVFVKAP